MDIKAILAAFALLSSLQSGAQSLYPGQYAEKRVVRDLAEPEVECFDLDRIRLLHSFRTTAGVFSGKEGGYMTVKKLGGWESLDCDLRGHITGHYLSAAALMYASTGDASDTSRILSEFFWETVTGRHTFVTGSCSDKEHFFDPDRMSEHLSGLGFRTREGIDLKPLYDTHHRRYIVYWNVVGK